MTGKRFTIPVSLAVALALGACSASTPVVDPSPTASVSTPVATDPAEIPTEEAPAVEPTIEAPVADEFSAVVNGVVIQGTKEAPVRIGSDTPGTEPAAQAGAPSLSMSDAVGTAKAINDYAKAAGKYQVSIGTSTTEDLTTVIGYRWIVLGENVHGNLRNVGVGETVGSVAEASAGPFTANGRVLDRAEYVFTDNTGGAAVGSKTDAGNW